jgi:methylated-DNA-protein-cysteine methyltransferase-like protein
MEQTPKSAILYTLACIPPGKVSSYGDIAKRAGYPGMARYVAMILKQLPEHSGIPWHRVVNHKRQSSFPPDSDLHQSQIALLQAEGISFSQKGIIPREYFW